MDTLYNTNNEIIITVDSNEGKLQCSVINVFEANQKKYISLLPKTMNEILLFRYKEIASSEAIELINIESDKEFNEALQMFDSLIENI